MSAMTNEMSHKRMSVRQAFNAVTSVVVSISMVLSLYGCGSTETLSMTATALSERASAALINSPFLKQATDTSSDEATSTTQGEESAQSEGSEEAPTPSEQQKSDPSDAQKEPSEAQKSEAEKPADEAPKYEWPRTIAEYVKVDEDHFLTAKVTYGEDAQIPYDAQLKVEVPEANNERKDAVRELLEVKEGEYVSGYAFAKVTLSVDGKEVQPSKPIDVVVETNYIEWSQSDAIEAALFGNADVKALSVENLTGKDDEGNESADPQYTRVKLSMPRLGEFGLAAVAAEKHMTDINGVKVSVLGPRAKTVTVDEQNRDEMVDAGKQLLQVLTFAVDPPHAWPSTLWIEARPDGDAQDGAGLLCRAFDGENLSEEVFGIQGTTEPKRIAADKSYGLLWKTETGQPDGEPEPEGEQQEGEAAAPEADAEPESALDSEPVTEPGTETEPAPEAQSGSLSFEREVEASDGRTYRVSVSYADSSELPKTAELKVTEVARRGTEYLGYVMKSAAALGIEQTDMTYAKVLDICLVDSLTGQEHELTEGAQVRIELLDASLDDLNKDGEVGVVHFGDETEAMDVVEKDDAVEFEAPSFSVYVLCAYTVDFHWGDYTYSINGEGDTLLSEVFDKLGVDEITLADVVDVDFSNPACLSVEKAEGDWLLQSIAPFDTEESLTLTLTDGKTVAIKVTDDQTGGNAKTTEPNGDALQKSLVRIEGSWAYWQIKVNPKVETLNAENPLTLTDIFTDNQSIDYASISVTDGVSYDYRGRIGTYVVPDQTSVTIGYRTRIVATPGAEVTFGNTARLLASDGSTIDEDTISRTEKIYPSASDVSDTEGTYMLKLFVYGDGNMQTGIPGAEFILLDANRRPLAYKKGGNAGEQVVFTTGADGYANVQLNEEAGDVSIEKNTAYYLEMIKVPEGYKKDSTLYSFMITDDPNYESDGVRTFFNGDTIKVRLSADSASVNASMRFSGNYSLTQEQQDAVEVILQKKTGEGIWEEVERHPLTDFTDGSITFAAGTEATPLEMNGTYRVTQENERPWDLGDAVLLKTTYYLLIGDAESVNGAEPLEFTVTTENVGKSFNVVINNEYEEPKLTITKMDKLTGHKLGGAQFSVKKAADDSAVEGAEYTTDEHGIIEINGSGPFESETLYYIVETTAPEGYLLPLTPEKTYFYFCNDEYLEPSILEDLPAGETAVNLTETYESISIDNQKQLRTIPVMKTWQGNEWPSEVAEVTIGLYQSIEGSSPTAVLDDDGKPRTATLTKERPYSNNAFVDMPTRDGDNHNITYSIKEESALTGGGSDVLSNYVQEYGVTDSGIYTARNKEATTLVVNKEWYDWNGTKLTDESDLAEQPDVIFDVYRTTTMISDEVRADGVTSDEMTALANDWKKVRSELKFGNDDNWTMSVNDLDKYADSGNRYYYYVLESVPSFGDEVYVPAEDDGTITIQNKVAPPTATLTVQKAKLVDDPREEAVETDFEFTLAVKKGTRAIRNYTVYDEGGTTLTTDKKGEVSFTLKPERAIQLTLPIGVTATVTEASHPEYNEVAASTSLTDLDTENDGVFAYVVEETPSNPTITFTNTLRVICKVVDKDGNDHAYESLKSALAYIRANEADAYIDGVATIQMLEDYTMPEKDVFNVQDGENIVLTTATTDTTAAFHFRTDRTEDTDTAIITRGSASGSMITNAGTLSLEKVFLDGAKDSFVPEVDGGIVNNEGSLSLSADTTLHNSSVSGKGGAIYSSGTISMPGGTIVGNSASSGSAIYLAGSVFTMTGGAIEDNEGASDGAVAVGSAQAKINLSGNPVIYDNKNSRGEWANVYLGVDSDQVINVVAPGLDADAHIGVRAMEGHREIGEQFGSAEYEMTDNLNCFVNDEYEYRGKLKEGTATNIVWNGLKLTLDKVAAGQGSNANDTFTITITSNSIRRSNYTVDGTMDYTITPTRNTSPGKIVFNNVKAGNSISVYPLPVGNYTIDEAESNYAPTYTGVNHETNEALTFDGSAFALAGDSTITVTNTRRDAPVTLQKTITDVLMGTESVGFPFTLKLIDADDTPIANYVLAEGISTDENGEATCSLAPANETPANMQFVAPVGATMSIIEQDNPNYRVTSTGLTAPAEGEGTTVEDENDGDNVFEFLVGNDGAKVTFSNVRKMAEIELRKELVNKVSETESFDFAVTLTHDDGTLASEYTLYKDDEDPTKSITTNENGEASIHFEFAKDVSMQSVLLTVPEGTKLVVSETPVTKRIGNADVQIYNTTYAINGGAAVSGTTAQIDPVSDEDESIFFTNTRKTQRVTVTNTVSGYSGNVVPFTYTATVTDGEEGQDDYDAHGFTDGSMTFELTTGQSRVLEVPYGATLNVAESFIVGYETTVKRGSASAVTALSDEFVVTGDVTVAFNNGQLIGLRLVNNTSSTLTNVRVAVGYGTKIYRVNDDQTDQEKINTGNNKYATLSIDPGKTAILEIQHQNSVTYEQTYQVNGVGPAEGYYYTINNEPSFHEFADPAVFRFYDEDDFLVKGKLRYSVSDSTVTFSEQPLVSFDANGGSWTTEMEGYRDRDGDRKVYQMAVTSGTAVSRPQPDPAYPTAENVEFIGWTTDEEYAQTGHATGGVLDELYDFDEPVTEPVYLYAVWNKDQSDERTVTVKNGHAETLTFTLAVTNDGSPVANYPVTDSVTTNANGEASFTLSAKSSIDLKVPDGAKLVIGVSPSMLSFSADYEDGDSADDSFTINSVKWDGAVAFTPGICKITDAEGKTLYDAAGKPAVYTTLAAAFTAYAGTLYTDASHSVSATASAVKMLVDEYPIDSKRAFPTKAMTLTTAGKDDESFPYIGVRDRSTLYRTTAGANDNCFTLGAGDVTITDIVLDGGSEQGVKIQKTKNGGLIFMNNANGVLNISTGATLRNSEFAVYDDGNNSRGGAIYATNGTVNVSAGLFSNLHAYQGGAICCTSSATLNVTGADGSTRFENCYAERQDGGAIYYNVQKSLEINGGKDKANPGIIFTGCQAKYTNGDTDASDGGAIYASTSNNQPVAVSGCSFTECSARTARNKNEAYGGGAICANKVKGLTVSHCEFKACDTLSRGGAIVVFVKSGETVSVEHSSFEGCNCKGQGGALAVYQPDQENGSAPAVAKTTKLTVTASSFDSCSSGTNNGSGGAIQCYVPRMEFVDSSFTDCWAGKEGGAINNYFANGYTAVWTESYMKMKGCTFIRCRAEDRYDPTALQHYGGGLNTKATTVEVTDSYFEDCVSTLKEGGALHLGGQGANSSASITTTTFKSCSAKNGGGAILSSHEKLSISDCNFYGCSSSASNGGAVYHCRNSRGDSTQKALTIENCTFSSDPEGDGETNASCSAAQNGGAVWTRATTTVVIEGCTIDGCTAGANGGGVYLDTVTTSARLVDGSITGCGAVKGSAVYVGKSATFSGNLSIADNTVSDVNSGAIHGGTLYFEGNVKVKNNTCSEDAIYKHDVLMQNNNDTTIYTTNIGLGTEAHIGVYVSDPNSAYANHGQEGQKFGTHGSNNGNAYLESFFNDRDDGLFGYQASNDSKIYWGRYLCKITDLEGNTLKRANGRDAVYQRLTLALDEFTAVTGGTPVYIKMLVENYDIQKTDPISNFPNANITLTTAGSDDASHPYRGTPGTVCTISRTNSTKQLFELNNANATFQLEKITLDGRRDKAADVGEFRMIEAKAGRVIVNGGTTFQYGHVENSSGGAIYISNVNASLAVHATGKGDVLFDHCTQRGNYGGGAIYAKSSVTIDSISEGAKTTFVDCDAQRGGAVMIGENNSANVHMSIADAEFKNCYSLSEGGAVYHNNNNNTEASTTISSSSFENCYTTSNGQWSCGGAVTAKTAYLTVDGCSFKDCYALSNGGAVNHGGQVTNETNRRKTTIANSTFENCKTTSADTTYGYGGSAYTRAVAVEVTGCTFTDSAAANHGGALYCENNSNASAATVSDTSFTHCSVTRSDEDGCGGAIYSRGKTLNLSDGTSIDGCTAQKHGGAVHMETTPSTINVADKTVIKGCYAKRGGAVYLKNNVTMNLEGGPEFTQNGYATIGDTVVNAEEGACIYLAEGSKINLKGAPRFSRNYITNERIVNGGNQDYKRQDLYLAGYSGMDAASIHIVGELTGDTIWVWPEQSPHRINGEQFAFTEDGVSAESLNKFRNALADSATNCSDGEYLAGVRRPDQPSTKVYWDKMYNIFFKKVDNKGVAVPGAEFTLYTDSNCTSTYAIATSADGETDTNAQGELLEKGIVDFTSVPIGVYYMKETRTPESFKVDADTVYIVLVGSPMLSPGENPSELWTSGALAVENAATLVQRYTVESGKYYGIFPLDGNGKAILRANLASASVGVTNVRNDYPAYFMKTDGTGDALPNAAFTIYAQELDVTGQPKTYANGFPVLTPWSRDGENYPDPVKSADGSDSYKDVEGNRLPKGEVYFRELPIGTFYLMETSYPDRNGNNRKTFFVESDRVYKLEVLGESNFTMSEWNATTKDYDALDKNQDGLYVVSNVEAVCKLTDDRDNLLYERGLDGTTLYPAIYDTLEKGFTAAQTHDLYRPNGDVAADEDRNPALKLKVLKDFTLSEPVVYTSSRDLTFTTAEKTAKTTDRYVFTTTRTSDTSRAAIKRNYTEDTSASGNGGALITIAKGAELTLQNINLYGQKSKYTGRAIHVTDGGTLNIKTSAQITQFKHQATTGEDAVRGGAVLLDGGTNLTIDGGPSKTAVFTYNEIVNQGQAGADGGAIFIGSDCTISIMNAQFTSNKATASAANQGNGGAIGMGKTKNTAAQSEEPVKNVIFKTNTATNDGGAICVAENGHLTVTSCTFTSNQANTESENGGEGGAIAMHSSEEKMPSLVITGGTFSSNKATNGNGGAVAIGPNGTLTLDSGFKMTGNSAARGGAVYVAGKEKKPGKLQVTSGTISGNTATEGSAVYAEDYAEVTIVGSSITANKASGENGGAINAGGEHTRLYFGKSPLVFDNVGTSNESQQRNVVLSDDSNDIINTTTDGLTGGLIGVYVAGDIDASLFSDHGRRGKPFGTFGDVATRKMPDVFINDRALALRGTSKGESDTTIYWSDVICKLTDSNGALLYKDVTLTVDGKAKTYKVPAVYTTIQDGFDAAQGTLYTRDGANFAAFASNELQLQMLKDVNLDASIAYSGTRKLTFTTAAVDITDVMQGVDDSFVFETERKDSDGQMATTALIARAFTGGSMVTVEGTGLTLVDITLDGAKQAYEATANGGIANVASGASLAIGPGAVLQNSKSGGQGGAVYAASGASVTVTGGEINNNESAGDGAGLYLAEGSKLYLSGNPYFGGTGTDAGGAILGTSGNWKQGALEDKLNGGQPYTQARQDIFIAGHKGKDAPSLVVTDPLEVDPGSIWVWASDEPHYEMLGQFAVFADGARESMTSDALSRTFAAFRNAQPDDSTGCGGSYLTGQAGSNPGCLYWAGGFDIAYLKVNSLGDTLNGATFTLYLADDSGTRIKEDEEGQPVAYQQTVDGELQDVTATSESIDKDNAIKIRVKNEAGQVVEKSAYGDGIVAFRKIPPSTYFLKETVCPKVEGTDNNYVPQYDQYKLVLDRDGTYQIFTDAKGEQEASTREVLEGDETVKLYQVVNELPDTRKVILRKVSEEDGEFASLEGAEFRIYRADWTPYDNEVHKSELPSGAFFVGSLPYGKYYIVETKFPDGHEPADYVDFDENDPNTWWYYTLTVNAEGYKFTTADGEEQILDARGTYVEGLFKRDAGPQPEHTYDYQIVLSSGGPYTVGQSAVVARLQRSVDGGAYEDYDTNVTWETGNDAIFTVSSNGSLTFKAAGTAPLTAYVNGSPVREVSVEVNDRPSADGPKDGEILKPYEFTSLTVSFTNKDGNTYSFGPWFNQSDIELEHWFEWKDKDGKTFMVCLSGGNYTGYDPKTGLVYYNGNYYILASVGGVGTTWEWIAQSQLPIEGGGTGTEMSGNGVYTDVISSWTRQDSRISVDDFGDGGVHSYGSEWTSYRWVRANVGG